MKRFLLVALLSLICSSVYAEVIMAPQWSEFCPVEYINAQSSKWNKNADYWYTRRTQIDSSISRCLSYMGEDLKECYAQIRTSELNKNKVWNQRLEQQRIEEQKSTDMYNRMQTINTINRLIDSIAK